MNILTSWFTRKRLIIVLVLAVAIWIVAGALWYTNVYLNEERRFWLAIENGLKTSSITKEVVSESAGNIQTQTNRLYLGGQTLVEGVSYVKQGEGDSLNEVKTTSISTPSEGFVKYDKIATTDKNSAGQDFNFDSVIGQWAKQTAEGSDPSEQARVFAESFVQLIPIANLDQSARREIMTALKDQKAYEIDFSQVTEEKESGFTVYPAKLNTKAYVGVLREVFRKQGLTELSSLDPEQYEASSQISLIISIDGGNVIRQVGFSADQYESYSGYGLTTEVVLPKDAISYEELQTRLQSMQ